MEPKPPRAKVRAAKSALIRVDDVASGLPDYYRQRVEAALPPGVCATELFWIDLETFIGTYLARERRRSSEASPIDQREHWRDIQNLLEELDRKFYPI